MRARSRRLSPTKDSGELDRTLPYLRLQLKALVARDIWDMSEYFSVFNERSEIVRKALQVISGGPGGQP